MLGSAEVWEKKFHPWVMSLWALSCGTSAWSELLASAWLQISWVTWAAITVLTEKWNRPCEASWIFISTMRFIFLYFIYNIFISGLSQKAKKGSLQSTCLRKFGRLWCIHPHPEITTGNSWKSFGCWIWMKQRDFRRMMIVCKRSVAGLRWQLDCIMLSLENSLALLSSPICMEHCGEMRFTLSCQMSLKQKQWDGF